jgi:hypothetical protein
MDASKLTEMRQQAANTYRSHWQPRDASEVTMRNMLKSAKNAVSTHRGPDAICYDTSVVPTTQAYPSGGFSTTYTNDVFILRDAGCAVCNDTAYGNEGGVNLLSCAEVSTILQKADNPVKMTPCCSSTEVVQRGYAICCTNEEDYAIFNFAGTTSISNPVFVSSSEFTISFINLPGTAITSLTFSYPGFGFNTKYVSITSSTNTVSSISASANSLSFNLGTALSVNDRFVLKLTVPISTFTSITG